MCRCTSVRRNKDDRNTNARQKNLGTTTAAASQIKIVTVIRK